MRQNLPKKIITHHAVSAPHHTHLDVARWHEERFGKYKNMRSCLGTFTGYHFIINRDGSVHQTRLIGEEGMHCIGQNTSSIGICFMGNFDKEYPTKEQIKAWKQWYKEEGDGLMAYPHRKYANKSCHGRLLDDDYWMLWVKREYYESKIEKLRMLISRLQALITKRRMK